ncbi:MAG: tetratricopeptide repeat protein [Candidatus Firestonebacteria bacterium]|nr:tetratricopeptide repeat protein [Candidatus Firestonebacteria bacterium]
MVKPVRKQAASKKNVVKAKRVSRKTPVPEVVETPSAEALTAAAGPGEAPISLKSSRRFWLTTLAVLVLVVGLVQIWGYQTGWGNPERLVQRYLTTGQSLTLAKRYDAAIRQYTKILNLKTSEENIRQAMIAMADLYRERHEWGRSIEIYSRLRAQNPNSVLSAWAGLQIGDNMLDAAQYLQAQQTFTEVSRRFPNSDWDAEARLGVGKALEKEEKFPEAIAAYRDLVKAYGGGFLAAEALARIGGCYELEGDLKSARAAYQTILDKYPATTWDDAKARLNRLDAGKPGEGVRTWGQSQ